MCMFQTKRGSLVQTHLKMDVIERWTIQTINEQMGIPTMNDYVTYMGEAPGVDFCHVCAQVLAKHFAIQTKNNESTPTFVRQIHHPIVSWSVVKRVHLHRAATVLERISAIKTLNRKYPPPPQPKLNSKETITYMVKEMSRMSVRSSITKILNSGI